MSIENNLSAINKPIACAAAIEIYPSVLQVGTEALIITLGCV